jgi:hypothetical protein
VLRAIAPVDALALVDVAIGMPLRVSFADPELRSLTNGGRVRSEQGHDLRFETIENGKLAHELDNYSPATGSGVAWVRIPEIQAGTNQQLLLYFGKDGVSAPEADPVACWAGFGCSIDLATGIDHSGNGADLDLENVTSEILSGMKAGGFQGFSTPSTTKITPSIIAITPATSNDTVDVSSKTVAHNSSTGNLLVFAFAAPNAAGTITVSATWNGVALTQRAHAVLAGVRRPNLWAGTIRGGSTGANNLVVTWSNSVRDTVIWVVDIIGMAASPVGATAQQAFNSSAIDVSAALSVQDADSLLVAVAGFGSGGSDPYAMSGWTEDEERQSGTGGTGVDISAVLGHRLAGAVGSQTLTVTGSVADDDRAICIVELLPS